MRVLVYHPWIYLKGGCERLWLAYLRRTRHEVTLATSFFSPSTTFAGLADLPIVAVHGRVGTPSVRRSLRALVPMLASVATARLPLEGVERLLISSESVGDFVALPSLRTLPPTLAYVHTPLKIVYDPRTVALLREVLPLRRWLAWRSMRGPYRALNQLAWRRYRRVLANSEEVRQRILAGGLAPASRIDVLQPGASAVQAPADAVAGPAYLLVAGRIMWQKRIELAIGAHSLALGRGCRGRLIIAGTVDEKSAPYLARLRALAAASTAVSIEPNPTDERFAALLGGCRALVAPAPSEDWGILPVEAMASGKPVIATDAGGPRESVLDGRTGFLCAHEPQAFAAAMERVWRLGPVELEEFAGRCRQRGSMFGWDRFARRLDEQLERA